MMQAVRVPIRLDGSILDTIYCHFAFFPWGLDSLTIYPYILYFYFLGIYGVILLLLPMTECVL